MTGVPPPRGLQHYLDHEDCEKGDQKYVFVLARLIGPVYPIRFSVGRQRFARARGRVHNAVELAGGVCDIKVELSSDGAIDVGDDGPGIPQIEREKLFEPFYRNTPKPTGAGLGLSIVRQIAQSLGGSISIVPQVCGARFRLKPRTEG